jgi:hypothetical protein
MSDTTNDLIRRIKNLESIPDSGAAYADDVLIEFLDQSLKGFIVPAIESALEEHFVVTKDFYLPPQSAQGVNPVDVSNTVEIPSESTGLRLRDVYVIGTDGAPVNLPRLTPTQAAAQNYGSLWGINTQSSNPMYGGFFLQGNTVQIFPYGLASGKTIRLTFQRAPADLCLTSAAGRVLSVTGDTVMIDKVLGWTAGTQVNAISQLAPYEYLRDPRVPVPVYASPTPLSNISAVSVVGNVITLPTGITGVISVGDWICPSGSSVFAQNIPRDLLPALCRKAAEMCLESAGDRIGQESAQNTYNQMIKQGLMLIAPRVLGKPVKILPTNSAFKASRGGWGRW